MGGREGRPVVVVVVVRFEVRSERGIIVFIYFVFSLFSSLPFRLKSCVLPPRYRYRTY